MRKTVSIAVPIGLVAFASLAGAPKAWAQPARAVGVVLGQSGRSAEADAKKHFDKAREHYANGRYREAIEQLETALQIDPKGADLLYNLGVIHEKLQEVDPAIDYYQRYVLMIDDAEEQERVEKIILRLEKARDELAAREKEEQEQEEAAAGDQRDEPERGKGRMDGWVIGAGVLAGLGLAGGTYFGLEAMKSRNDDPPTTGGGTEYQDLVDNSDRAKQMALYADIGFGVGVVAGTAAMLLYFTRDAEPEASAARRFQPAVAVLPGGAAASLRVGF
jgi:tetratricopeptide (TPR) repeat protein